MSGRARLWAVALAATVAIGGAGCGGGESERSEMPPPPAHPEDFPKPAGKTLAELEREIGAEGPVLAPSVSELAPGDNRFGFGLFDRARTQIADAAVAVYVAPLDGGEARGPFTARYESLKVDPPFRSRTSTTDPDSAKSVYVADVRFPDPGRYEVLGVTRLDDRLVAATPAGPPLEVKAEHRSPDVGDAAPRVHTETATDARGDVYSIDTREPPSTMHETDFADVVGRKPAILLFSTPALCQSRVCGPVADIAEQVKAARGGEAAFIHQEIFEDNQIDKGFREPFAAWKLRTEPWVFTIDARGRIAARIEGAFSVEELNRAVDAAVKG